MRRRDLLKATAAAATAPLWPEHLVGAPLAPSIARRARPRQPEWPSTVEWQKLKTAVGGNLIEVHPLFAACADDPKNRACQDLSVGWGSNSQWRTDFRRDYHAGTDFYFNVDGTNDLRRPLSEPDRDGLTRGERIELLTHRCFITVDKDKPLNDLWPYDDVLQLTEGATRQGTPAG